MYKLKKTSHDFEEVDGPFAGRKYAAGKAYEEEDIPPGKLTMFEALDTKVAASATEKKDDGGKGK